MTDDTTITEDTVATQQFAESSRDDLYRWVADRRPEGYCPAQIFNAIVANKWSREAAVEAMRDVMGDMVPPRELDVLLRGTPIPDLSNSASNITVEGHEVQVLCEMQNPRIVVFGGLMSDDECDELIEIARPRLYRSTVQTQDTPDGTALSSDRTSSTTWLWRNEFDVCKRVDARVQALMNWPTEFTEDWQVVHYAQGAEYKPHQDYFDPQNPWSRELSRGGNRCGTLLLYLNTPVSGGGTVFPDVPLEVRARKGMAVYFGYPTPDPSCRTLHGGLPVNEGEKWVATRWFRQGPHR